MKVLFCHGSKFVRDENGYLYNATHNDQTLSRYYTIADELFVLGRIEKTRRGDKAENKGSKITIKPFTFIQVPNYSTLHGLLKRSQYRSLVYAAVKEVDYVVVRVPSPVGYMTIRAAKELHKPYMLEVVGCIWDALWHYDWRGKLLAYPTMQKMKRAVYGAPYVIYVTNKFLQNRYPTSGQSIGLSDVTLPPSQQETLDNRKKRITSSSAKLLLGTIGSIDVFYKGHHLAIQALSALKKRGIDAEYQLVGRGDSERLEQIARKYGVGDRIKFLGILPHNEIFAWLDQLNIYIQPSLQEGLCRSIIEAMSRALPCVVSNAGGNPELIEPSCCFDLKKHPVKQLTNILENLVLDRDLQASQSVRNFEKSKEYEFEHIEQLRLKFYRKFKEES